MKKIFCVLAGMLCSLLCVFTVKADVIWEPEDAFYSNHAKDCTYVNRQYTANGPDGKVIVYKSPELPITVDTWENGYQVLIQYVYEDADGVSWGIYDDYRGTVGWMPMEYMELVYDSIAFREEHEAVIVEEQGSLAEDSAEGTVFAWKYPGSESYTEIQTDSYMPEYHCLYTDGNGKRWGCVGYYFGHRDFWICLDAPTAGFEQLFPEGVPYIDAGWEGVPEESLQGQDGDAAEAGQQGENPAAKRIAPKPSPGIITTAIVLVALAVAGTGILLVVLKRKKERN